MLEKTGIDQIDSDFNILILELDSISKVVKMEARVTLPLHSEMNCFVGATTSLFLTPTLNT